MATPGKKKSNFARPRLSNFAHSKSLTLRVGQQNRETALPRSAFFGIITFVRRIRGIAPSNRPISHAGGPRSVAAVGRGGVPSPPAAWRRSRRGATLPVCCCAVSTERDPPAGRGGVPSPPAATLVKPKPRVGETQTPRWWRCPPPCGGGSPPVADVPAPRRGPSPLRRALTPPRRRALRRTSSLACG